MRHGLSKVCDILCPVGSSFARVRAETLYSQTELRWVTENTDRQGIGLEKPLPGVSGDLGISVIRTASCSSDAKRLPTLSLNWSVDPSHPASCCPPHPSPDMFSLRGDTPLKGSKLLYENWQVWIS